MMADNRQWQPLAAQLKKMAQHAEIGTMKIPPLQPLPECFKKPEQPK